MYEAMKRVSKCAMEETMKQAFEQAFD